jgi:hypothetical protein
MFVKQQQLIDDATTLIIKHDHQTLKKHENYHELLSFLLSKCLGDDKVVVIGNRLRGAMRFTGSRRLDDHPLFIALWLVGPLFYLFFAINE